MHKSNQAGIWESHKATNIRRQLRLRIRQCAGTLGKTAPPRIYSGSSIGYQLAAQIVMSLTDACPNGILISKIIHVNSTYGQDDALRQDYDLQYHPV
jgi:hypothetical protein